MGNNRDGRWDGLGKALLAHRGLAWGERMSGAFRGFRAGLNPDFGFVSEWGWAWKERESPAEF